MGDGEYAVWLSSQLLIDKKDGGWSASVFIASDQVGLWLKACGVRYVVCVVVNWLL